MKPPLLLAIIPCLLLNSCNKETIELSQNQVNIITSADEDLGPILQLTRECEPKEIIRNTNSIEGYADKQTYYPGENVFMYIHSRTPEYSVKLYRFGESQKLIFAENRIDGKIQNYLCYAYSWGCDWESTYNFALPNTMESGFYSAKIENENGFSWITFIVKPTIKNSEIALIASSFTWCAYNDWGGGSFYTNRIEEETPVSENITFLRPNPSASPFENSHLAGSELHLVKWLENKKILYDMYSDLDLHESQESIKKYKVIILQTHPEYYSESMYTAINDYVNEGGHLMYLGANGIYAKVVYNPILKRLETRKKGTNHYYENTKGGLWRDLNQQESKLLGIQYDNKGYNTYYPYKVLNEKHFIFQNTGLKNGNEFGNNCTRNGASGHETDKITPFSPVDLEHIAKGTNPSNGGADMVYYETLNKGKVFSVGSITYTSCLNDDPIISQITENVLVEFLK